VFFFFFNTVLYEAMPGPGHISRKPTSDHIRYRTGTKVLHFFGKLLVANAAVPFVCQPLRGA